MNNNNPITSPSKYIPAAINADKLNKLVRACILCLPLMLIATMSYSFNGADIITSHSVSDVLDSPNQTIIGFGFIEKKIHLIALLFMAFLTYMGHRDQKIQPV